MSKNFSNFCPVSNLFKYLLSFYLCYISCAAFAQVHVDKDVLLEIKSVPSHPKSYQSLLMFFANDVLRDRFIQTMDDDTQLSIKSLEFMPAAVVTFMPSKTLYTKILAYPHTLYVGINKPAGEKIEINTKSSKPKVPFRYPGIDLWWEHGYKGQTGVLGLIDSGIAPDHPALARKKIIINQTPSSHFQDFPQGVRTAHGTGVACIYAGFPSIKTLHTRGVAYKTPVILSALAGEGTEHQDDYWLTYSSLNWLMSFKEYKPSVINYSFGNGDVTCPSCPDWSAMAKVVDYVVNYYGVLWVTSAGNNGYIKQRKHAPYVSTMTVPAESYNALTVANMNMYTNDDKPSPKTFDRASHAIYHSSSRGPTLIGRKKPDLAAPGNDTLTCAPDSKKYQIKYTPNMNYKNGYRLMGGTSSAAPHVGGAVLLLKDAGITHPMAIKALLINSADTWTDSNKSGPNDPKHRYRGGHHSTGGSEWNPTYGWGYMNLRTAFYQRDFIMEGALSLKKPMIEYRVNMLNIDKVTLVHERRVGFNKEGRSWALSRLRLEIFDVTNHKLLSKDYSLIDNVHQVSLCNSANLKACFQTKPKEVLVRVSLKSPRIDGGNEEFFALALPAKPYSN